METEEKTNQRILQDVIDETITNLFRDILRMSVPEKDMPLILNEGDVKERLLKILKKPQKEILYPQNGYFNGSYSEVDLGLLYILIRNVSKIPGHQKGWGETPSPTDQSVAANVDRLRVIRNEKLHPSGKYPDFETLWNDLITSIEHLEKTLPHNKGQYKEEAETIKKKILRSTQLEETIQDIQGCTVMLIVSFHSI